MIHTGTEDTPMGYDFFSHINVGMKRNLISLGYEIFSTC